MADEDTPQPQAGPAPANPIPKNMVNVNEPKTIFLNPKVDVSHFLWRSNKRFHSSLIRVFYSIQIAQTNYHWSDTSIVGNFKLTIDCLNYTKESGRANVTLWSRIQPYYVEQDWLRPISGILQGYYRAQSHIHWVLNIDVLLYLWSPFST